MGTRLLYSLTSMKLIDRLAAALNAIEELRMALILSGHPDEKLLDALKETSLKVQAALEAASGGSSPQVSKGLVP